MYIERERKMVFVLQMFEKLLSCLEIKLPPKWLKMSSVIDTGCKVRDEVLKCCRARAAIRRIVHLPKRLSRRRGLIELTLSQRVGRCRGFSTELVQRHLRRIRVLEQAHRKGCQGKKNVTELVQSHLRRGHLRREILRLLYHPIKPTMVSQTLAYFQCPELVHRHHPFKRTMVPQTLEYLKDGPELVHRQVGVDPKTITAHQRLTEPVHRRTQNHLATAERDLRTQNLEQAHRQVGVDPKPLEPVHRRTQNHLATAEREYLCLLWVLLLV